MHRQSNMILSIRGYGLVAQLLTPMCVGVCPHSSCSSRLSCVDFFLVLDPTSGQVHFNVSIPIPQSMYLEALTLLTLDSSGGVIKVFTAMGTENGSIVLVAMNMFAKNYQVNILNLELMRIFTSAFRCWAL